MSDSLCSGGACAMESPLNLISSRCSIDTLPIRFCKIDQTVYAVLQAAGLVVGTSCMMQSYSAAFWTGQVKVTAR